MRAAFSLGTIRRRPLGDYLAGPNHTLPTAGTARFYSPLSVDDYVKKKAATSIIPRSAGGCADDVQAFARKEGLDAHANSVTLRVDRKTPCKKAGRKTLCPVFLCDAYAGLAPYVPGRTAPGRPHY